MNIAVFSDTHGRVLLAFKLCRRWEEESGERLDLILQSGDLGAFPDLSRLDQATRRYAERDPTELGFSEHFVSPSRSVERVLSDLQADMVFVRGNHEDHVFLDKREQLVPRGQAIYPVDCYGRVFCIKGGAIYTHQVGEEALRILGLGRMEGDFSDPKHFQDEELERASDHGTGSCDVLLTHQPARDFVTKGSGSELIQLLVLETEPSYHLFGHISKPVFPKPYPDSQTIGVKVEDLEWQARETGSPLKTGAMGILRWHGPDRHQFELVDAPWMQEYTAHSSRYL